MGGGKPRIEFIDLAKGVCILLVMLLHCCREFYLLPGLVELRMPLYFVLSGLFFKTYGGFADFSLRKINKLIVPFVFFFLLGYFLTYLYHGYEYMRGLIPEVSYNILDNLTTSYNWWCTPKWPNNPVWFLLCLFWDNIIFYFIITYCRRRVFAAFLILFLAAGAYLLACHGMRLPFFLDSAFASLPFFYLGFLLKNSGILYPSAHGKIELIVGITLVLAAIASSSFHKAYYEFYIHSVVGNPFIIYLVSSSIVVGVLLVCKQIGRLPYVSYIGRYSVIALGFHICMIPVFTHAQHIVGLSSNYINFLLLLLSMPLFIKFSKRYIPSLTAQADFITPSFRSKLKLACRK